jgi:protease-4
LRVDSPGGSAFASDEIWRAVERVKAAGKPVIVSMGGYAASGGYYVAAGADAIFALPSTVTGSIGVYGGKYNVEELLSTLHINTETYLRGRNAGMFSLTRPFDAVEFAALDRMIGETYAQFKDRVATGRGMSAEEVEQVARGRVWTGEAASSNGLVDELGGFFDAVATAQYRAGMSDSVPYSLITYNPWYGTASGIPAFLVNSLFPRVELPPELQLLLARASMQNERIYAMLPYQLEIR